MAQINDPDVNFRKIFLKVDREHFVRISRRGLIRGPKTTAVEAFANGSTVFHSPKCLLKFLYLFTKTAFFVIF